jgi:hypothetical protein
MCDFLDKPRRTLALFGLSLAVLVGLTPMARALTLSGGLPDTVEALALGGGLETTLQPRVLGDGPALWRFLHPLLAPPADDADNHAARLLESEPNPDPDPDLDDGWFGYGFGLGFGLETGLAGGASGADVGHAPRATGAGSNPAAQSASRACAATPSTCRVSPENKVLELSEHPCRIFRPPRVAPIAP